MWQHFTEGLRRAVFAAAERADTENGADVSPRHLLLGVVHGLDDDGARVLGRLGLTPQRLEPLLPPSIEPQPRDGVVGAQTLTPEARHLVEAAYQEAERLGDGRIGTEHLLLAALRDADGEAGCALRRCGVTLQLFGGALMRQQDWRVRPPTGVAAPGLRQRRVRAGLRAVGKAGKQITFLIPRLNQPFVPFVLFRTRTIAHVQPFHRRLLKRRFYWDTLIEGWVAAGHAEVSALLQEKSLTAAQFSLPTFGEEPLPPLIAREFRTLDGTLGKLMLFLDPPNQTRLRSLFSKQFTPRTIGTLRAQIQEVMDALLDGVAGRGGMDVIRDVAFPLPALVIARMLGVVFDDNTQFKKWSDDFARYIIGFQSLPHSLETRRSLLGLMGVLRDRIAVLRRTPEDNLLSVLIQAEEQGDRLSEDELIANCLLLLAAGHETTTNLIGNGLYALLKHPAEMQRLRDDPDLMPSAVEEFLRYESPVQWTSRVARQDFSFGGRTVRAGQHVNLALGAANRDPEQFPLPDRLDIARRDSRHLAFGNGSHYCLGAALARLEGETAFRALLQRFPDLKLASERCEYQDSFTLRALKSLPVLFS